MLQDDTSIKTTAHVVCRDQGRNRVERAAHKHDGVLRLSLEVARVALLGGELPRRAGKRFQNREGIPGNSARSDRGVNERKKRRQVV